jgi:hypothetical protein
MVLESKGELLQNTLCCVCHKCLKQNAKAAALLGSVSSCVWLSWKKVLAATAAREAEYGEFTDNEQSSHNPIQRDATPQSALRLADVRLQTAASSPIVGLGRLHCTFTLHLQALRRPCTIATALRFTCDSLAIHLRSSGSAASTESPWWEVPTNIPRRRNWMPCC